MIPFFMVLFLVGFIFNGGIVRVKAEEFRNVYLRDKFIPLKTTIAGNGKEDLDKLQVILKDKKSISMGTYKGYPSEIIDEIENRMS